MTRGKVCIVMLAAGRSERFGTAKLLAEYRGKPLLHHALFAAQETCPGNVCLVVGHNAHEVGDSAAELADLIMTNEDYATGMGSSIACGVRACREQSDAILIMLADQPLISSSHLAALVNRWTGKQNEIIASRFSGTSGPPVLFASALFDQLEDLHGDVGAREILRRSSSILRTVKFEAAAVDIDTPADLEALAGDNDA
jgi:molybdenum cofactor cytidylyltransferase